MPARVLERRPQQYVQENLWQHIYMYIARLCKTQVVK